MWEARPLKQQISQSYAKKKAVIENSPLPMTDSNKDLQ